MRRPGPGRSRDSATYPKMACLPSWPPACDWAALKVGREGEPSTSPAARSGAQSPQVGCWGLRVCEGLIPSLAPLRPSRLEKAAAAPD